MSENKSGHTVDTLKEMYDRLFDEREKRYQERFDAQEKALITADKSLKEYKEGANEIRAALNDYQSNTMPRLETENRFDAMEKIIKALELSEGRQIGRDTTNASSRIQSNFKITVTISAIIGVAGIIIALIIKFA